MAERRMFAKSILSSDDFIDLPIRSRLLYFDLAMQADDDGMINNARSILRMNGLTEDDLQPLIDKDFLISFSSGILVIRHWRVHNMIRYDRYKKTAYQKEFDQLTLQPDKTYALGLPNGNQRLTQDSIGKVSLDNVRVGKDREEMAAPVSVPDTVEEAFDLFWEKYPRQHDRPETLSMFRNVLSSGTDPQAILDGLERYLFYIQMEKIESRYIMYPVTWLKKQCWQEPFLVSRQHTTKDLEPYVDFSNLLSEEGDNNNDSE